MRSVILAAAFLVGCNTPSTAPVFGTDSAIGPFALDPLSPVIARGSPGSLDELGATAPSVFSDAAGRHAVYLGIDSDGGTHLLDADETSDGGVATWVKRSGALVDTSGQVVGRPAAVELSGKLRIFYDTLDSNGNPQIVSTISNGTTIAGASEPAAIVTSDAIEVYAVSAADQAIHQYSSPDGVRAFTDNGKVLGPSNLDGGFDSYAVSAPTVQIETSALDRTLYRLWYTGTNAPGGTVSIGLAGSFDGLIFQRYNENPVRFHGDVASVYAVGGDGGYQMLYSQTAFSAPTDISLATGP